MSPLVWAAVLAVAALHAEARKPPAGISSCSRNDPRLNECALRNANAAIPLIAKGNPSYGMFPMDPLHIPEFRVDDTGSSRQVALDLSTSDVTITGLRHERITKMELFDLAKGHLRWSGEVPRMEMLGRYEVRGRVLILPIRGSGALNITMEGVRFNYSLSLEDAGLKNGLRFVRPVNQSMKAAVARMHINLENLFGGDRALSEQMNIFLNENWRELEKDLGPPIIDVLSGATNKFMDAFMRLVPYDQMFTDDPA